MTSLGGADRNEGERGSPASSDRQRLVATRESNVLVLAGPGAGKTWLLTEHAAWLATHDHGGVLLLTFTQKAAGEMSGRVERKLGDSRQARRVRTRTFHAFGLEILSAHGSVVGLKENPVIITDKSEVEAIANALALELRVPGVDRFSQHLESWRRTHRNVFAVQHSFRKLLAAWNDRCLRTGEMDPGAVITLASLAIRTDAGVLSTVQHHAPNVLVDEAQDSDAAQLELLDDVLGVRPDSHLFVVMDPDQSLYGWRGADPVRVRSWCEKRGCAIESISENFRCAPKVQSLARSVLGRPPVDGDGGQFVVHSFESLNAEAEYVANYIRESATGDPGTRRAVLARADWRLGPLRACLMSSGIEVARGGRSSWDESERMVLLVLRAFVERESGSGSSEATRSLAERLWSIDSFELDKLERVANDDDVPLGDLIEVSSWRELLSFPNVRSPSHWLEDAAAVANVDLVGTSHLRQIARRARSIGELLQKARRGPEEMDSNHGLVVTTIHGSKGLEFDEVFVLGCEEGVIPSRHAKSDAALLEEARALYVAVTRAAHVVHLCWSQQDQYGRPQDLSRFLRPIDAQSRLV